VIEPLAHVGRARVIDDPAEREHGILLGRPDERADRGPDGLRLRHPAFASPVFQAGELRLGEVDLERLHDL